MTTDRKPNVSFIIPVYKVEQYLRQCVESITSQSYKDIEILLVDDGSPDNSPALCEKLASEDPRIVVIHKKNGGLSDARNVGLKKASGDYVIFLDSDDWWCDKKALSTIVEKLTKTNADVLIFRSKKYYQRIDSYKSNEASYTFPKGNDLIDIETLMQNSIFVACAWDKVIKRSVLVDNKIEFVVGQLSEDIEWCCKLLSLNLKYAFLNEIVHVYRQQNGTSITANISNKNLSHIQKVIYKWAKIAKDEHIKPINNFLALEFVLWCAISNKATGDEGKKIIRDMSCCFYLIRYNRYPRVAIVSKFSFLGYSLFRRIICLGYAIRKGL